MIRPHVIQRLLAWECYLPCLKRACNKPESGEDRLSHTYLHSPNVDRQDSGEKEHLEEEVRHQAHNSKEAELLEQKHTVATRLQAWRADPSELAEHSKDKGK